jgi:hypothetical protein
MKLIIKTFWLLILLTVSPEALSMFSSLLERSSSGTIKGLIYTCHVLPNTVDQRGNSITGWIEAIPNTPADRELLGSWLACSCDTDPINNQENLKAFKRYAFHRDLIEVDYHEKKYRVLKRIYYAASGTSLYLSTECLDEGMKDWCFPGMDEINYALILEFKKLVPRR